MNPKQPKILIIQTAYIGDVILATSLIEYIQSELPDSEIHFFLKKGNESIVETSPFIKKVYVWNKSHHKIRSLLKYIFEIRSEKYDYVINIQRFFNSGLITALSGAKEKIGFDKNPLSFLFTKKIIHKIPYFQNDHYLHEVERNVQLVKSFIKNEKNLSKLELKPKIYFTDKDKDELKKYQLTSDYIVIAPSSVWFTKQWHESKWIELITHLTKTYKVILLGAPSDLPYIVRLYQTNNENVLNLCGKLTLRQSALLMREALRVIVNDSAPLHLASSVNAKTTAIFCSTVPEFGYTPLSDDQQLIQLSPRLDCMPCGLHGHKACPKNHFKCALDIDVAKVINTIQTT